MNAKWNTTTNGTTPTEKLVAYVGAALQAGKTQKQAYEEFAKDNNLTIGSVRTKYQLSKPGGVKPRVLRRTGTIIENPRSERGFSAFTFRYNGEPYNIAEGTSLNVVCATMGYLKNGGAL